MTSPTTHPAVRTPACFVGETLLATTWGPCRLAELARITTSYGDVDAQWSARINFFTASLAEVNTALAQAQAAAEQAEEGLFKDELDKLVDEYTAQSANYSQQLTNAQERRASHLNGMLPQVYVVADDMSVSTQLARVVEAGETTELVSVQVDDVATAPRVVCTTGQVFVTEDGDFAASDLVGHSIERFSEQSTPTAPLLVEAVNDAAADDPVAVFDVVISGSGAVRVSAQGTGATALVRVHGGA